MKTSCCLLFIIMLISTIGHARDHLIYSVGRDIPMGYDNEVIRTNYYLNIGSDQGVNSGTILDVFRVISKQNPYDNLKRINYRLKIGELKVLHSDDNASIAVIEKQFSGIKHPILDVEGFMIGDTVSVNVQK
jgi:hypothetical protein